MHSKIAIDAWRKFLRESINMNAATEAFQNTDPAYLEASVKQRNPGPGAAGSTFLTPISVQDLVSANWAPYNHPNIMAPAVGWRAEIPGILGIAEITSIPPTQPVKFQPAHGGKALVRDGPKAGLQLAEVVTQIPVDNRQVGHTTLIVGPAKDDPTSLMVWTFFPGDPTPKFPDITMEDVRQRFGSDQETVVATAADAASMGYNFVKHVDTIQE
jgi:hypothetical protein